MITSKTIAKLLQGIVPAIGSVLLALIIGSLVLLASGSNPIDAYTSLLHGAFGTVSYLGDTLQRSTPIIFTGLAISIAFKGGMFNIGAEGQLLVGAMAAAIVGYAVSLPAIIHIPLSIIVGMLAGAIWASIPALLKAFRGVHEVITTIMMNYIALNLGGYLIETLRQNEIPQTPTVLKSAEFLQLNNIFSSLESSRLNIGFILAVVTAVIMYIIINKTKLGFEIRAMGFNPQGSENAGISIKKQIITIMLISGALAALGGVESVLGVHRTYLSGVSSSFGFEGIAVALLANNNPIGVIFSALLFGALSSGGQYMNLASNVPVDIVGIIQGLIILFVAISQASKFIDFEKLLEKRKAKKSEVKS